MPLFDFQCPAGHVVERMFSSPVDVALCVCGLEAKRLAVQRAGGLVMAYQKGEPVVNYMEAAQEVEYRASQTDNPEAQAASNAVRPAMYRAQARVWAEGKNATWNQRTDREQRLYAREGKK